MAAAAVGRVRRAAGGRHPNSSLLPDQSELASYRQCVEKLDRGRARGRDRLLRELRPRSRSDDDF